MRRRTVLLATASLVWGSPHTFSVHDDLFAFPQFEVIFSDACITESDAESRLSHSSSGYSGSSISAKPPSSPASQEAEQIAVGLLTRNHESRSAAPPPESGESYEYMMLNSSPYLCSIPYVPPPPKNSSSSPTSKADEERELGRATDRGVELLKDLEGHCLYFVSGWWSYSFCYNTDVRQFHALSPGQAGAPVYPPMEDENTPSFVLGKFRKPKKTKKGAESQQRIGDKAQDSVSEKQIAQIHTKGDIRYMVQKLQGGTLCDITGRRRKIEIQFHCHPQTPDRIGWIKEISTCSYLMVIYTPRLCNDVAFLPPRETKAHKIVCREIVPEADVAEWQARKQAEVETDHKTLEAVNEPNVVPPRPMVGDIEVGAFAILGESRIDKPKVVKPSDGKGEVIAMSDPTKHNGEMRTLSDGELKKMDLDPATVDQLREELKDLAGNKAWKLEVVDTPGGYRELRGIVDDEEEGQEIYEGKGLYEGHDVYEEGEVYEDRGLDRENDGGVYERQEGYGRQEIYKDQAPPPTTGRTGETAKAEGEEEGSENESEKGSEMLYKDEL